MKCRVNWYFNQSDANLLGIYEAQDVPNEMWKPSIWHVWSGNNMLCQCLQERW